MIVEAQETTTFEAFRSWGFKPIKVPFRNFLPFGMIDAHLLFLADLCVMLLLFVL